MVLGCRGEAPSMEPGGELGPKSFSASTIDLSPISSYTENVHLFPALMHKYDHRQIYKSGTVNLRFHRFDQRQIRRDGTLAFKIKLKGKDLGVAAIKVNGKVVWKYWRISSSLRDIKQDFLIEAGSEVHLGEYSGHIEYVHFTPSDRSDRSSANGARGNAASLNPRLAVNLDPL
jgi:hypothetical protein